MIAHYDILQGSEAWHELRYGKIGGTLSEGLFVKSDTLLIDLLSQLTEDFEMDFDSFINADMQRGNDLEPLGREQLGKYTGHTFKQCGWLQCEEQPLFGISPDGITEDETITCEIKCPNKKKHMETILNNEIPLDNIHQCIHYFTVNPRLSAHYFCSFRPESIKPLFVKMLTKDSLINLGTNAKPRMVFIYQAIDEAKNYGITLSGQIKDKLTELSF